MAMSSIRLEIAGLDKLARRLRGLAGDISRAAGNALRAESEIEMTEAKRRTPVLTGTLRASGMVNGPNYRGRDISVRMSFGGPAAPYAIYVHENMEAFHKVGQAKFLESTLNESARFMARRVAARIRDAIV